MNLASPKVFFPHLNTILLLSVYVIDSTADFVKRIKNISVNHNSILASLDVVSLYPSLYNNEIVKIIETSIDSKSIFYQDIGTTLKSAINLITQNNDFVFNNKYYKIKMVLV